MIRANAITAIPFRPMKSIVTAEDVWKLPPGSEIATSAGAIVTPWAREVAATRGVRIVSGPVSDTASERVVALGADHGGYTLKEDLKPAVGRFGWRFLDLGTFSADPVDYPDFALAVARAVREGRARLGVVVDGAGIGSAIAANKVPGVRAATCHDVAAARNAREHNDANVLSLGAKFVDASRAAEVLETFLASACTEERHARRVGKIKQIEETYSR
jgi:ribose 5-phosphate isomerase B